MVRHVGSEKEENLLFTQIGELVVRWNACEDAMRLLLYRLSGGGNRIEAIVWSLPNIQLSDSIRAISFDIDDAKTAYHLRHAEQLFTLLRSYRNYLVHGPISLASSHGKPIAFVQEVTSKGGKLTLHQKIVRETDVQSVVAQLYDLQDYLSQLIGALYGVPNAPDLSSLEKPPLPEGLKRNRTNLIELRRQE